MMHAHLAFVLTLIATAHSSPGTRERLGYEREIDSTNYNQVPKLVHYVLSDEHLATQKNRAKLITRPRPVEEVAADNVILESNVVQILKPTRRRVDIPHDTLVRRRRGYNLENVWVPSRYPYLAVPHYTRYRRRG